jgi:predicted RNase H-like HicB family nuclease
MSLNFAIETEQETDGRWIAEIPSLPGVMVYGASEPEAVRLVKALALHVVADGLSDGAVPEPETELVVCFSCAR